MNQQKIEGASPPFGNGHIKTSGTLITFSQIIQGVRKLMLAFFGDLSLKVLGVLEIFSLSGETEDLRNWHLSRALRGVHEAFRAQD